MQNSTLKDLTNIVKIGYGEYASVVKCSAKTTLIKPISSYNDKQQRIRNRFVEDHGLEPLTAENAHRVSTIINIGNPVWGTKSFHYDSSHFGFHSHTNGQALLFEDEFKFWLVATFKA